MNITLRSLHIFNHAALIYFLASIDNYWLLGISFLVFQIILVAGVSAGLHRFLSHKSFSTYPIVEKIMILLSVPATLGTPVAWVGTHRLHHAYSDSIKDPHSPKFLGFLKSYFHIWKHFSIPSNIVKDVVRNKTAAFVHKHYLKILLTFIVLLYIIDPLVGIIVYSIPAVFLFHSTAITNAVNHSVGYRNYQTDDASTNILLAGWLIGGEGFHNNHHNNPSLPYFSHKKIEFDLTWQFIKLIRT